MLGIALGSGTVLFTRRPIPPLVQKTLLGFASGVMVAASMWSLLLPAVETAGEGKWAVAPAAIGFLLGMGFLLLIDNLTPHLHLSSTAPEGPRVRLPRSTMLLLAVSIHHLPEGMAIGVVQAGAAGGGIPAADALVFAIGIAIQNIPEGAIVSVPLRAMGRSRLYAFAAGCLSGVVQPGGAIVTVLLAGFILPMMPLLLAFAAGAMLYVVVEELIPEASAGRHTNLSTLGFSAGFVLMMVLDIVLE